MPDRSSASRSNVVFVANVGNRDVSRDGQALAHPRSDGRAILDAWADESPRLDLPLLRPSLSYAIRRFGQLERIVLFASDQPESAGSHRESDTIHLAGIAQRLLETDSGYRGKVTLRRASNLNPSLYDETYPFYERELANAKLFGEVQTLCVLASGGTPAMNLGLLVAAIERFGDRCAPLYLERGAREPQPLNLGQQLRQSTLRQVALSHLEQYQFVAAGEALHQARAPASLIGLATYASTRLNFDWEGAWRAADHTLSLPEDRDRALLVRLRDEARALMDREDAPLFLGERFHRARVAHTTGAYSEFLTLMVGLQEGILQAVALQELGIDYREDNKGARKNRERQFAERPGLRDYLLAQPTPGGRPIEYTSSTRLVLRACAQFVLRAATDHPERPELSPERRADLEALLAIEERLEGTLIGLRNAAVHRDGGASRQRLDDAYNPPHYARADLLTDLERLTRLAGGRVDHWALEVVRDTIRSALGRQRVS